MNKGVSIFYEFHEQGYPHVIAGIYSPQMKTEEQMRTELLALLGHTEFHERDQPTYVNHNHVYAHHLLGEEMDKELVTLFKNFLPEAVDPEALPLNPRKYQYYDSDSYNFIWNNRYHKQLLDYRNSLLETAAAEYREKRIAARREERGQ